LSKHSKNGQNSKKEQKEEKVKKGLDRTIGKIAKMAVIKN